MILSSKKRPALHTCGLEYTGGTRVGAHRPHVALHTYGLQYTPGTWVGAHRSRPALRMSGFQHTAGIQRELQDLGKSVFACA